MYVAWTVDSVLIKGGVPISGVPIREVPLYAFRTCRICIHANEPATAWEDTPTSNYLIEYTVLYIMGIIIFGHIKWQTVSH